MRVKTAAGLVAVAGALVFAPPAMAWTYEDCVKVNFNHPDCKQYEKPPVVKPPVVTPPVVPPVTPPVTIPAPPAPPVEVPLAPPEVVPPVAPEAPKVEKPKKPKYDHPDRPRTGTQGKTEQRGSSYTAQGQTRTVSASSDNGTLPYTGLPAGLMALAGAGLFVAGRRLRRR